MRKITLCLALCLTAPLTGCAASLSSIISVAENYLTYISTFVQIAQGIWAVIAPLLSASVAPTANSQFAKAIVDVNSAAAVLSEAINAAQIAGNPNPNLQALINDCVSAVDEVATAISQYTATSGAISTKTDLTELTHMQTVIHRWKH